jgi:hypothetical protein
MATVGQEGALASASLPSQISLTRIAATASRQLKAPQLTRLEGRNRLPWNQYSSVCNRDEGRIPVEQSLVDQTLCGPNRDLDQSGRNSDSEDRHTQAHKRRGGGSRHRGADTRLHNRTPEANKPVPRRFLQRPLRAPEMDLPGLVRLPDRVKRIPFVSSFVHPPDSRNANPGRNEMLRRAVLSIWLRSPRSPQDNSRHFRYMAPPFITNVTFCKTLMSSKGSPGTAITSAR